MNNIVQSPLNRSITAMCAGGLAALAFPPFFLWYLIPLPFVLLYGTLDRAEKAEAFRVAGGFAIVFYLFHTYWFFSFHPVALPFMLIFLGLVYGLVFYGVAWLGFNPFSAAAGWMVIQGCLGYGYHAFPWSRLATALAENPLLIQPVRLLGEWAWGGLLVACFFTGADYLYNRRSAGWAIALLVLVVGLIGQGGLFISSAQLEPVDRQALLVQPSVVSNYQPSNPHSQLGVLHELTEKHAKKDDLVIWPETALMREPLTLQGQDLFWATAAWKQFFRELLEPGFDLFTGLRFTDPQPGKLPRLNGAVLLRHPGEPAGFYTKRRPVPGGEHLPLMGSVEWVNSAGRFFGTLGYRAGEKGGLVPIRVGGETWQAGVQICFEDAFAHDVRRQVRQGADLLINISNDSWSRSRASHWQHFHRARVRAVETGRMVLRNGNTGVSALIDPLGRIQSVLSPYQRGVIRGNLVRPLEDPPAVRWGALTPVLFILVFCLISQKDRIRTAQID